MDNVYYFNAQSSKLTKCDKAVLAATLAFAKRRGGYSVSISELVNGVLEDDNYYHDADGNFICRGCLIKETSENLNAMRNVSNEEIQRTSDVFRDIKLSEKAMSNLHTVHAKLDRKWVFTSGYLKDTEFSLEGDEGISKLIFCSAMSRLLNVHFAKGGTIEEKVEARGSHLKSGDYVQIYMLLINLDSKGYTSGVARVKEVRIYFETGAISTGKEFSVEYQDKILYEYEQQEQEVEVAQNQDCDDVEYDDEYSIERS